MSSFRSFPIFVDVATAPPLVVGGTTLAAAKVRTLLLRAPRVTVAAASLVEELHDLAEAGTVEWLRRMPTPEDLRGRPMVVSAMDNEDANTRVAAMARDSSVPVNVPDRPMLSTFAFGAMVNRDDVSIAIGTDGTAPVLATNLRAWLERELHPRLGRVAAIANEYRDSVARLLAPGPSRRSFWQTVLGGTPANTILAGNEDAARSQIDELLASTAESTAKGRLILVGAGPGDADLLTLKAVRAIKSADIILHDRLVSGEVLACARREVELIEVGKRKGQRSTPQAEINKLIVSHALSGKIVVRLKGGDGFIFGRAAEELAAAETAGIDVEVVPGITTAQATAAELKLPLTSRGNIRQFSFVTGTGTDGEPDLDWKALAEPGQAFAVYMGLSASERISRRLIAAGADPATKVVIVENATRPDQRAVTTPLTNLAEAVHAARMTGPAILMIGLDWTEMGLKQPQWVETFEAKMLPFATQAAARDALSPDRPYAQEAATRLAVAV